MTERPLRAGFTFYEVLVVTALIGVLVALLLPAVQAAREAALRASCSFRVSQVMMGIQSYEALHRVYPPGSIEDVGPIRTMPRGYHHNWISQILPLIEETNIYSHIDWSVGVYHENNRPARRQAIKLLRCPSSRMKAPGYTDYAAVHHDLEAPIDTTNNGVFYLNSRTRAEDIHDGLSHTMFIGEKFAVHGDLGWMSGTRASLRNTGVRMNRNAGALTAVPSGWPPGIDVVDDNATRVKDDTILNALFGTADIPAFRLGSTATEIAAEPPFERPFDLTLAVGGFGSEHPGGAQFGFGDGSVRFIPSSTAPIVYVQLGNRRDGSMPADLGF